MTAHHDTGHHNTGITHTDIGSVHTAMRPVTMCAKAQNISKSFAMATTKTQPALVCKPNIPCETDPFLVSVFKTKTNIMLHNMLCEWRGSIMLLIALILPWQQWLNKVAETGRRRVVILNVFHHGSLFSHYRSTNCPTEEEMRCCASLCF